MGRIIAGYVRVSTLKQKNDGVSVDMQKEMIIKHALMMELVKEADEIEFFIDDGYSGKSLERPKIKELIEKIKKDEVYAVICYDLSRLSREMFDSNSLLRMFNNHGAALKCIYDQTSIKTASDRFSTNINVKELLNVLMMDFCQLLKVEDTPVAVLFHLDILEVKIRIYIFILLIVKLLDVCLKWLKKVILLMILE